MRMEEDELKQKKLEELQQQREESEKQSEAENRMQQTLKKLLGEEARARLNNVRLVNKELYAKAVQAIINLAQRGYVKEKLADEQMKEILRQLKDNREINIKRK